MAHNALLLYALLRNGVPLTAKRSFFLDPTCRRERNLLRFLPLQVYKVGERTGTPEENKSESRYEQSKIILISYV